jgi:hypothetical protein
MKAEVSERGAFVPYPTNRVVGTIQAAPEAQAAIQALLQAGFERDDVDVLHGESDVQRLDPTGAAHGFLAQFQRVLMRNVASVEDYEHLMQHVADVRAGRFVVMVRVKAADERHLAADILTSHGAASVGFFGRWAWESLQDDGRAPDPAPGRTYESRIDDAPVRVRYHSATAATISMGVDRGGSTVQATVTPVRNGVSMLSWPNGKDSVTVHVHDYENGTVYAVVPDDGSGVRHVAGTVRRIS